MFDLEEVVTIEREEWTSVETNSGGEYVMICGMKMIQLLSADNWDFQEKVDPDILNTSTIPCRHGISCPLHCNSYTKILFRRCSNY